MTMDRVSRAKRKRRSRELWVVLLLIYLHCGGVACYRDSVHDYVSFEDTREWILMYSNTCRGKSKDGFREPRYLQFPKQVRPAWESKTPISINTEEVIRKKDDNLTLHIYNNPGIRGGYSVSYGFQRNKECLHGQDKNCIVNDQFGSVRALVVNAERFTEGQDLNYIKDHFLIEDPEKLVTILNGGSVYERKFYEAVFLGGYPPKALQNRGKSSHVIDGKSYPMEIYMYFVDETVASVGLATILVVLVEESDRDNQHIKPIISAVEDKLYDQERRFLHNDELMYRTERQFHNQGPSFKYDIFDEHRKKGEDILLMERLAASASLEENFVDLLEMYEKMQALGSQLLFLDEDLEKAEESYNRAYAWDVDLENRITVKSGNFPFSGQANSEIHFLVYSSRSVIHQRRGFFDLLERHNISEGHKEYHDFFTYDEWFNKKSSIDKDPWSKTDDEFRNLFEIMVQQYANHYYDAIYHNVWLLNHYIRYLIVTGTYPDLNIPISEFVSAFESTSLKGPSQIFNLTFYVHVHCQKYDTWVNRSRDDTLNKKMTVVQKYRYIKDYADLIAERRVLNNDIYNHFFGDGSLHQLLISGGYSLPNNIVPDFSVLADGEYKKRHMMDGIVNLLDQRSKVLDYKKYIAETEKTINELAEANNFDSPHEMREVLHNHKYGYHKEFNMEERREYLYKANFQGHLPEQEKREGFVNLGNMEMSEEKTKAERKSSPLKVKVEQNFQISWLLPHTGGYYYYHGSSPVPPCFRAQNVIVFKKPITMSRRQIETLSRIPIAFDRKLDILHTTPILHDNKFMVKLESSGSISKEIRHEEVVVNVYDQPRNHLFLGHDGVHKNSVEEYENRRDQRDALRKSQSAPPSRAVPGGIIWILIVVAGFANLAY